MIYWPVLGIAAGRQASAYNPRMILLTTMKIFDVLTVSGDCHWKAGFGVQLTNDPTDDHEKCDLLTVSGDCRWKVGFDVELPNDPTDDPEIFDVLAVKEP